MDIIEVGGRVYGVVVTQDDAGAEIGLWCGDEQAAAILINEQGLITFGTNGLTVQNGA